ncbi:MAG: DUF3568 family protein [Deltaproteobacteria bacterium]|jgi:hypothetical protein|nr:DUF3568 family protein [Deltaproteobacteria bacterium]
MISTKGKSMKIRTAFLVIAALYLLTGCVAVVVGAGAGAGTYAYVEGALKRSYEADYEKTYQVCVGLLKDLNQPILKETTDGVHTIIDTERSDKTPMTIKVTILEPGRTEVSVRTGTVGLWKKDISEQYHKFIEERLAKN